MKGSIWKQRDRYVVGFWYNGRQHKITTYKNEPMLHRRYAEKCLAVIQGDYENAMAGLGTFRIEKYTRKGWTDVIEYFEEWLKTKEKKKPATYKGYKSYFKNWIKPFFEQYPVLLHEIQLDTLTQLLDFIKLTGKGKQNVMYCFHTFLDYAWRSRRIPEIPPFPKKEDYGINDPIITWLPEDRQMAIINQIPEIHRPIFLWLKYHYRRPAEACALHKEDYDPFNGIFIIRRSISARRVVESTKTGVEHLIPCDPRFRDMADYEYRKADKFLFTNPRARKEHKRYTNESLNILWKQACEKVGESIDLYSGLKHSSCSQLVNEKGFSISDVQILTDHKRLDSVKRYAKVNMARKKQLMDRASGVVNIVDYQQTTKKSI